jgi:hypothetical protein
VQHLADHVRRAFELLAEWDAHGDWPDDSRTGALALKAHGVSLSRDLARDVYSSADVRRTRRIEREQQERARAEAEGVVPGSIADRFGVIGRSLTAKSFAGLGYAGVSVDYARRALPPFMYPRGGERLEDELDDARADVRVLRRALERAAVPPDLRRGLSVLAAFALVGIVYPLVLLANGAVRLGPWWRASVLVLFTAGLVAVFAYLAVTVRDSIKDSGDNDAEATDPRE